MLERGYVTFRFQGGGAQPPSGSGCPGPWFNLVGVAATILRGGMVQQDGSVPLDLLLLYKERKDPRSNSLRHEHSR